MQYTSLGGSTAEMHFHELFPHLAHLVFRREVLLAPWSGGGGGQEGWGGGTWQWSVIYSSPSHSAYSSQIGMYDRQRSCLIWYTSLDFKGGGG
jgi:hypothetical protein